MAIRDLTKPRTSDRRRRPFDLLDGAVSAVQLASKLPVRYSDQYEFLMAAMIEEAAMLSKQIARGPRGK